MGLWSNFRCAGIETLFQPRTRSRRARRRTSVTESDMQAKPGAQRIGRPASTAASCDPSLSDVTTAPMEWAGLKRSTRRTLAVETFTATGSTSRRRQRAINWASIAVPAPGATSGRRSKVDHTTSAYMRCAARSADRSADWRSGRAMRSGPGSTWQSGSCTGRSPTRASRREAGPSAADATAPARWFVVPAPRRRRRCLDLSFRDMTRR